MIIFHKLKKFKVIVVIPAFNEAKAIKKTLVGLEEISKLCSFGLKTIVVDDGSSDGTADVARQIQGVRVIQLKINKGPGEAIKQGLLAAIKVAEENDVVVTMEADNTSDPALIFQMVNKLRHGADVVCASRQIVGGTYQNFPFLRLVFSLFANGILRILFPIKQITDYTIFFRGYRAKILKRLCKEDLVISSGFVGNAEILIKMRSWRVRFDEVPLVYQYKNRLGKSRMKVWANLFEYLRFLILTYRRNIL